MLKTLTPAALPNAGVYVNGLAPAHSTSCKALHDQKPIYTVTLYLVLNFNWFLMLSLHISSHTQDLGESEIHPKFGELLR